MIQNDAMGLDENKAKQFAVAITKALPQEGLGTNEYLLALGFVTLAMCKARGMPVAVQDDMLRIAREMVDKAEFVVDSRN